MKYLIAIALFFLVNSSVLSQKLSFVWADDQDYEPYIYLDTEAGVSGIFHDIMVAVFARMDMPLTQKLYPWKRAQKLVKEGHADGMVTIPTKERLSYLIASDPIIEVEMRVHYNKLNLKRTQIADIRNVEEMLPYSIIDYQGDGWAESNLTDYNVSWAPNYTSAVWMIAANRGDIFLDDPISIQYHVNKQIKVAPALSDKLLLVAPGNYSLFSAPHCLLINKNSQFASSIEQFNAALKEIKENGEYDQIIKKYLN